MIVNMGVNALLLRLFLMFVLRFNDGNFCGNTDTFHGRGRGCYSIPDISLLNGIAIGFIFVVAAGSCCQSHPLKSVLEFAMSSSSSP